MNRLKGSISEIHSGEGISLAKVNVSNNVVCTSWVLDDSRSADYQLGVQPIVLGSGLPLFKNVKDRINLKLLKTKTFGCGAVIL